MKMVGKEVVDPSAIGKHPKTIKAAQRELTQTDVLVCGKCHNVFHFIESFKEHKDNKCDDDSKLKECRDTKQNLWAFYLWKSSQLNNNNQSSHISPWNLYQKWIRMEDTARDTWIVAGKTILTFAKLGQGLLQEMPVRITKTVIDSAPKTGIGGGGDGDNSIHDKSGTGSVVIADSQNSPNRKSLTTLNEKKSIQHQLLHKKETNLTLSTGINSKTDKNDSEQSSPAKITLSEQSKVVPRKTGATIINQTTIKAASQQLTPSGTATMFSKTTLNRRAKRSVPSSNGDEFCEEIVEKIIAKRYNPRRKFHEYLVKWEGFMHDQNTWEPQTHLVGCPQLLDTFEKQLARQKEQRSKQIASASAGSVQQQKENSMPIVTTLNSGATNPSTQLNASKTLNRIQATVKTIKPPNSELQQKQDEEKSVVNVPISGATAFNVGIKRKHVESESDDFDLDEIPVHTVKKGKNGTTITVTETKHPPQSKAINRTVNGTTTNKSLNQLPLSSNDANNAAEVVITKDSTQNSGVYKKVGSTSNVMSKTEAQIRVLSKGENTTSGIVRLNPNRQQIKSQRVSTSPKMTIVSEQRNYNTGNVASNVSSVNSNKGGGSPSAQISQVQTHRIMMGSNDTLTSSPNAKSSIQSRIIPTKSSPTPLTSSGRTTIQRVSSPLLNQNQAPTSGKILMNRNIKNPPVSKQPAITPEQKIIQLSKSGDLKVTRKIVTTPILSPPPHQSQPVQQQISIQRHVVHQPLNRRQQQQQNQHVQRGVSITVKSESEHSPSPITTSQESFGSLSESQSDSQTSITLCEITGKVLQPDSEEKSISLSGNQEFKQEQEQQHQQSIMNASEMLQSHISTDDSQLSQSDILGLVTAEDGTQQFLANEDGTPILVTGEDGIIYQVAGKNAEGQTVLIAQGPDGEQQIAYVAAEEGDENALALDNAVAEAAGLLQTQKQEGQTIFSTTASVSTSGLDTQLMLSHSNDDATTSKEQNIHQPLTIQTDSQDGNIPAEVVQAESPSPGGTRRVVLLLQDGTFMMTEMQDEEYRALNIGS